MSGAETASNIVSTVGFPIAACIFLGLFVFFLIRRQDGQIEKLNEQHDRQIEKLNEQHREDIKQARADYAAQIETIMQQHKAENEEMLDSINRVAEALHDTRDMILQLIAGSSKPPD